MSITIKQAFEKLAMVTGAAVKNPWFVGRNLNQAFADIADNIEGGGGGGSTVEVTQVLESGTKVATITVDDTPTDIFAPTPAEPTDVEVTQVVSSGTKIATISVDDVETDIYAPASGGGGDWTYLGSVTGQSTIDLPSGFKELLVFSVPVPSSAGVMFSYHYLADVMNRVTYKPYLTMGYSNDTSTFYGGALYEFTNYQATEQLKLVSAKDQGSDRTSDCKTIVYYK